jgi:hypothetical protein
MYQQCEIPDTMEYQLAGLQWIDFFTMAFDAALDRLLKVLQHGKPTAATLSVAGSVRSAESPLSVPAPSANETIPPGYTVVSQAAGPGRPVAPVMVQPLPIAQLQQLAEVLCGRWNLQVSTAAVVFATLVLDVYPNGTFHGQLMRQVDGLRIVNGVWRITPMGALVLQGQQSTPWATVPYYSILEFTQISPTALVGISNVGEQVVWSKIAQVP